MLGNDIAAALPTLRAQARSRMTRPCVAKLVTGVGANPETGADETIYETLYEGVCRLRNRDVAGSSRESGGATVTVARIEWHIPHDAPRIPVGTVISFEDDTPDYRTTDTADGDDLTARRYPVEVAS